MSHGFDNGIILLEYELLNEIDNSELKDDILDNVNPNLDKVSIIQENNILKIEIDLMEKDELELLKSRISQTFGENMQIISSNIIGSIEPSKTYYTIMMVLTILLLIGGIMIIKGILMLKKRSKN